MYNDSGVPVRIAYTFPLPPGDYNLILYFMNGYVGTDACGDREFDILVDGVCIYHNFDPVCYAGNTLIGCAVDIPHTVVGSEVDINIRQGAIENPTISGLQITSGTPSGTSSVYIKDRILNSAIISVFLRKW